ncbi:MAG: hypothetical protein AAGA35_03660 [Patescibacteria group bacterium]
MLRAIGAEIMPQGTTESHLESICNLQNAIRIIPLPVWREHISTSIESIAVDSGCISQAEIGSLAELMTAKCPRAVTVRQSLAGKLRWQLLSNQYSSIREVYPELPKTLFKCYSPAGS